MRSTLFHIPKEIGGLPLFGFGLLLGIWIAFSLILLAWLVRREGLRRETWSYVPLLALIGAVIAWVLPRLCDARGLPVRGYGVMLLLAVAAAVGLAVRRARRVGLDPEIVYSLAFWAVVPGIIGARLFYVLRNWPDFQRPTTGQTLAEIINVTQGGLIIYGGLIGALVGLAVFIVLRKLPMLATLDLIAPSLLLGMAFGRLGCFLNGCCYGGVCHLPWAVTFPPGSPPFNHQVTKGEIFLHGLKLRGDGGNPPVIDQVAPGSWAQRQGLKPGKQITSINGRPVRTGEQAEYELLQAHQRGSTLAVTVLGDDGVYRGPLSRSAPVHPTQIYAALNGLVLCLFLLAYDPFARRDGQLWAMFLTLYPVTRFLLEAIRDDEPQVWGTGLTPSQNISVLLLAAAVLLWVYLSRRPPGTAWSTWHDTTPRPRGS